MESKIDWSKAPEVATHYAVGSVSPFEMRDGDDWFFWSARSRKWVKLHGVFGNERFKEQALEIIQRPSTPSWSGEGLPPVGVVCEVFNRELSNPEWEKCTILFAGKHRFLYDSESCAERCGYIENLEFRPVRTTEQIAADEREAAIKEMMSHIYACLPRECWDESGPACFALYDAGYRKP